MHHYPLDSFTTCVRTIVSVVTVKLILYTILLLMVITFISKGSSDSFKKNERKRANLRTTTTSFAENQQPCLGNYLKMMASAPHWSLPGWPLSLWIVLADFFFIYHRVLWFGIEVRGSHLVRFGINKPKDPRKKKNKPKDKWYHV